MKFVLLLITTCFALANAQFYYDKHGESRGAYKDSLEYSKLVELAKRFNGPILVKKPVKGVKPRKNLEKIPENKIQRTFNVIRNSLRKELWLEVEKNEIVKTCVDKPIVAWETSLNAAIYNDSCLVFQAPTFIGVDSLKVYFRKGNKSHKINLAIGMKYLKFKNKEVLLGYNEFTKEQLQRWFRRFENEDPERIVSVTGTYLVDKYPITNCEFTQVMWDSIPEKSTYQYDIPVKKAHREYLARKKASVRNEGCSVHDTAASKINLYLAMKYANARSIREGIKPYYIFSETDHKKEAILDNNYVIRRLAFSEESKYEFILVSIDSTSDGYRLPYLDEWTLFARGGDNKKRAPWGDSTATFEEASKYARFNTKPPRDTNGYYYAEPVGQLLPNGYGLYDIFGLVRERVLLRKPLFFNAGYASCFKGGDYDDYWYKIHNGIYEMAESGMNSGFRLIRNIGNNAKWKEIKTVDNE